MDELKIKLEYNDQKYDIDLDGGTDLSIPNRFDGLSPSFYGSQAPLVKPLESENFIGDIEKGGSCNVPIVTVDIHCSGTHTECSGHINNSGLKIADVCPRNFLLSQLITVSPVSSSKTNDTYHKSLSNELIIPVEAIEAEFRVASQNALVIRTSPNHKSKRNHNYDSDTPSFFSNQAIEFILDMGIDHLLVDLPSIDRGDDDGLLGNHHRFFSEGVTISELLYIPDQLEDGLGFLQIQIPNWHLDAAPSRPIFFPIEF